MHNDVAENKNERGLSVLLAAYRLKARSQNSTAFAIELVC